MTCEEETPFFDSVDYFIESDNRSSTMLSDQEVVDTQTQDSSDRLPQIRRRTRLPEPTEKEKGISLWSIIKDSVGKDLTRVCLPVYFNEPLSSLQKCFEDLEYSYLLDQAYQYGKMVRSLSCLWYCMSRTFICLLLMGVQRSMKWWHQSLYHITIRINTPNLQMWLRHAKTRCIISARTHKNYDAWYLLMQYTLLLSLEVYWSYKSDRCYHSIIVWHVSFVQIWCISITWVWEMLQFCVSMYSMFLILCMLLYLTRIFALFYLIYIKSRETVSWEFSKWLLSQSPVMLHLLQDLANHSIHC